MTDLFFIFKWYLLIFITGILFLPLSFRILPAFLDKGYIFSKVLGIGILSYLIFLLGFSHVFSFTRFNSVLILAILGALIWITISIKGKILIIQSRKEILSFLKENRKLIIFEEALFFLCILFWSYVRAHNPDIHDLEKFMDFGFLNSILRAEYFPPQDMWFTPYPINYYYFGHLMTAVITKISAIPSGISYNLMLATLFAFTFTGSFSIATTLVRKVISKRIILYGLLSSFIVTLSGNLQTIYAFFKPYDVENVVPFWNLPLALASFPNSYWYPNATRFIYHTIHEFPIYSFVVSDLHGHVLSIPLVLLTIAFLINLFFDRIINVKKIIILSFFLSLSYMTNAWDSIIYFGLSLFVIFYLIKKFGDKSLARSTIKTAGFALLGVVFFVLFSLPFNQNFSPFASQVGMVCPPKVLINIGNLGPFIFEESSCQKSPIWQILILFGFFLFFVVSYCIYLLKSKKLLNTDYLILILIIFSLLLIIAPEFFYLKDIYSGHFRANTMFKLFYQAFIILGLVSSYIIARVFTDLNNLGRKRVLKFLFLLFSLVLFCLVSIYPYFAINSAYDLKTYKTLDGVSYIKELYPSDYEAIVWLNKNIKGQPVILEAQGDSYTDYARVSSNTGLPTVLGWTVHEWLWRGSYSVPEPRIKDVETLYETESLKETLNLIKKYSISYVFIGDLERQKYEDLNKEKFEEIGEKVFSSGDSVVYKIH